METEHNVHTLLISVFTRKGKRKIRAKHKWSKKSKTCKTLVTNQTYFIFIWLHTVFCVGLQKLPLVSPLRTPAGAVSVFSLYLREKDRFLIHKTEAEALTCVRPESQNQRR